ncbi:MAG TPA: SGNH/GDSL hydrolase family protein [Puia sp.]|nr:SGNH/GDSL hydrolase family protein [Puia sp.]
MKKILCLLILWSSITLSSFTHHPLTWVAIGDSITYLNDHPDETGNRLTKGYLTQVTQRLPYIHYINQGHNGWTSSNIARSIEKLGLVSADVYSVFLGTNDWWHSNQPGVWNDYLNNTGDTTIYGSFRIIINKLRSLNKDAAIILVTPMPRADFVYIKNATNNAYGSYKDKDGRSLEQVADVISAVGRYEHLTVVDLYHEKRLSVPRLVRYKRLKDPQTGVYRDYPYPDYIGVPFNPDTDEYPYPPDAIGMTYDGLHPSDKGDAVIAKRLVKALKKL